MKTDELADHLFTSVLGALDIITVHIGDQFGLYDLLHRDGPLTVDEVAERSGMQAALRPRVARAAGRRRADRLRRRGPARRVASLLALRRARGGARRPGQPLLLHAVRPDGRGGRRAAAGAPGGLPLGRWGRLAGLRAADAHGPGGRQPPALPRAARLGVAAVPARGAPRPHRRRVGRRHRVRRGLVLHRDRPGLPGRARGRVRRRPGQHRRGPPPRRVVRARRPGVLPPRRRRSGADRGRLRPGDRVRVHPRHAGPGLGADHRPRRWRARAAW